jgi:hypothetical protein
MTLVLIAGVSVSAFITSILNPAPFYIEGIDVLSARHFGMISYAVFCVQFMLMASVVLGIYGWEMFKWFAPYLIIHLFVGATSIFPPTVLTVVFPISYFIAVSIKRGTFRRTAILTGVYGSIHYSINLVLVYIVSGRITFGYYALPQSQYAGHIADLLIACIIYALLGGVNHGRIFGLVVRWSSRVAFLVPESVTDARIPEVDREAIQRFLHSRGFDRFKRETAKWGFQFLQAAVILGVCAAVGHRVNGLIIMLCVVAYGLIIRRRLHVGPVQCTLIEIFLITAMAVISPSYRYTIYVPVMLGFFIVFILYRVRLYMDEKDVLHDALTEARIKLDTLINKPFRIETASADEIRARCVAHGKNDEYAEFCIMAFRSGLTRKEIAEKLHLSFNTVKEYKRIRKAELEAEPA